MEKSSEVENAFQIHSAGGVKNKQQTCNNEGKIVKYSPNEITTSTCSFADESKQLINNKVTEVINFEKEPESSKISSTLDSYCKTSILNESSDFVECELEKKLKNKSKKCDILLCEICKEDITHLDVYNRGVHVNNCIDKQISSTSQAEAQIPEAENIFILECPLCFKHFSSPELRSNHIKKCGKSKGLSTQSIIKALELQERHALERISLGLPAKPIKPVKPHKNPVIKKVITEPKNKAESDIQLAKALSLSLTNSSQSNDIEVSENITTVMLKPPSAHQRPGKKTKKVLSGTPQLVLRTEEERRKLLLDKVAAIVSPVIIAQQDSSIPNETDAPDEKQKDDNLEMPLLWSLSSKTSEKADYYIEQLLDWIQPSDVVVGAKLCHLSQIAGHEIVTQLPCDYTFSNPEENNQANPSCEVPSTTDSSAVIECLCSLVASSWMSDIDIHTACGTVIPAHKLIMAVRCPPLKQDRDFCSGKDRVVLKWENVTFEAALQFLNFIYTGNIEIRENTLSDLFYLADKYEMIDLQSLLHAKDKTYIKSKTEVNKKMSPIIGEPSNLLQSPIQLKEVKEIEQTVDESQENMNTDLEIVFNCINSSLKPSQSFCGESSNLDDTLPFQSSQTSEVMKNDDAYKHELVTDDFSEKTSTSNCLSPKDNCPASPVIFDVNDSDSSDNEDAELPMNCSQVSTSHQSKLMVEELDLCSTESNNSEDSVKFLQSSYTSFDNLLKTPNKVGEDNALSMSPKFSKVPSSSKVSSPLMNKVSQDSSLKSGSEKNKLTILSCKSNEHVLDVCDKYEPHAPSETLPSGFHLKYDGKAEISHDVRIKDLCDDDQKSSKLACFSKELSPEANNISQDSSKSELLKCELTTLPYEANNLSHDSSKSELLRYELTTLPYESNGLVDKYSEFESPLSSKMMLPNFHSNYDDKIRSLDSMKEASNGDSNLFRNSCINDKSMLNKMTSSVISENVTIKNSNVSGKLMIECERGLSIETSPSKSNMCSVTKPNSAKHSSPDRNTGSPEVLICDSDSDSKSPPNISHEISPLCSYNVNLSQRENKSSISSNDSPKASRQSSHKAPMYEYNPVDDPVYETFNYFNYETYPEESDAALLHSPTSAVCAERQPSIEKDDSVLEPKVTFSKSALSAVSPSVVNNGNIPRAEKLQNAATPSTKPDILHPQFQLSDSPVTPLPDYKNMMTPEIKQELRKIGVKALPRKKAVAVLSHVYNETHPLVNNDVCSASNSESLMVRTSKENKATKSKKRKNANENTDKPAKKQQKETHPKRSASQESDDSSSENPEWLGCVPEISFSQNNEDSPSKPSKDDIESVKKYINFNEELYSNILNYKPLNLVEFHQELKNNDIKISIQKLMDFFDEQCITFTCPRKEEYQKKQNARTQRFRKNMIAKLSKQAS